MANTTNDEHIAFTGIISDAVGSYVDALRSIHDRIACTRAVSMAVDIAHVGRVTMQYAVFALVLTITAGLVCTQT